MSSRLPRNRLAKIEQRLSSLSPEIKQHLSSLFPPQEAKRPWIFIYELPDGQLFYERIGPFSEIDVPCEKTQEELRKTDRLIVVKVRARSGTGEDIQTEPEPST